MANFAAAGTSSRCRFRPLPQLGIAADARGGGFVTDSPRLVFETSAGTPETGSMFLPMPTTQRHAPRRCDAFTLIELLVVIAIIAILAGLTLAAVGGVQQKAARSRAESEIAALSAAIDSYKLDLGVYPASQTDLLNELTGRGTVNTNKVYFEPTAGMVYTNATPNYFVDPWGVAYKYTTNPTFNIGFFDLLSWGGGKESETNKHIRN